MSGLSDKAAWQYVPISSFLTCREGKYKPDAKEVCDLQRLSKIDFSGQIHVSDKPSKTDMIIVMPHDLVISGINVAKGAIAVHQGDKPIAATIHYSAYTFDETKIDIEYFKRFLQSQSFVEALQAQVKGGIKTEIKPKQFLPLMIYLPELSVQKEITRHFQSFEQELLELSDELNQQGIYLKKLRQSILQEAIEGKLTADWRAKNLVIKGDPNTDAKALLAKIQAEKQRLIAEGKLKKEKPLPAISDAEKPFELPDGWVWVKMDSLVQSLRNDIRTGPFGSALHKHEHQATGYPVWGIESIDKLGNFTENNKIFINQAKAKQLEKFSVKGGDIIISRSGTVGELCLLPKNIPVSFISTNLMKISLNDKVLLAQYFVYQIKGSKTIEEQLRTLCFGTTRLFLTQNILSCLLFALPPIMEQTAIVEKVQHLLAQVDALETELKSRQVQTEQLMQAVLAEAFSPSHLIGADMETA